MILSLKRPENHLICILSPVPSQKRPGGIGIIFFWHFFCIKLKITMKVLYFLHGFLISFLVLIMSASNGYVRHKRASERASKEIQQRGQSSEMSHFGTRWNMPTTPSVVRKSKALSTPHRKLSSVNVRAQRNARWDWTRKDSSIERHRSFRRWDWSRETLDFERLCKGGTSSPWARIRESHAQRSADPDWSGENS